jgi:hypothetical protein
VKKTELKKRQYSMVSKEIHNYINEYTKVNKTFDNNGQALAEIVEKSIALDSLGIDLNKFKKLELIIEISKKNGKDIDLKILLNRMIESEFNETVKINEMDKKEVIKDSSINVSGSAKVRINHFIDMIKEHNSKSDNKLMLTQTLLSKGIDGNGKRVINLEKIFAADKSGFAKGCGSHRNAIKEVCLDNNNFDKYNAQISDLTARANNMKIIKNLEM